MLAELGKAAIPAADRECRLAAWNLISRANLYPKRQIRSIAVAPAAR
jgi:hypothetical protein